MYISHIYIYIYIYFMYPCYPTLYYKRSPEIPLWNQSNKYKCVCVYESESESCSVVFEFLQPYGLKSPWNSPCQNTGVGSRSLLQRIFPIQGSNPGLPHCRWILYQLSHQESPSILEWVAYPFSRGSSQPRDWTQVSHIAGGFFTTAPLGKPIMCYHWSSTGVCIYCLADRA